MKAGQFLMNGYRSPFRFGRDVNGGGITYKTRYTI